VFNKEFITDNVFTSNGAVTPIFFLGEENIEKQKQVEKLKGDIHQAEKEGRDKEAEKHRSEDALDDFKKERSKSIKDLLSSSGGNNPYNNYDKRSYQVKCDELLKLSDAEKKAKVLDKSDLDAKKRKKDSAPLEKLQFLEFSYPDAQQLIAQKKTRILRFLHTHSHAGQISDPEHDLSNFD